MLLPAIPSRRPRARLVGRAGASGTLPFEILPGRTAIRISGSVSIRPQLPLRQPLLSLLPLPGEAEAAAAAAALAWPTGGYDLFVPRLLVLVLAVYMLHIDGSLLCYVRANMLRYRYEMPTIYAMLTVYSWIGPIGKVLIFPTLDTSI